MKYLQGYFHLQKMPELIVPVLNEIFGTNYPLDVPLEQLRNEHQTLNGEKLLIHTSELEKRLSFRMPEYR